VKINQCFEVNFEYEFFLLNFKTKYVVLKFPRDFPFSFLCSLNTHYSLLSFPILLIHSITIPIPIPTTHSIATHPMLCFVILFFVTPCHVTPSPVIICYATLFCVTSFCAMPCRVMYSTIIHPTHYRILPIRLIKLTNFNLSQIIIIKWVLDSALKIMNKIRIS
jgi:hypothetical protein